MKRTVTRQQHSSKFYSKLNPDELDRIAAPFEKEFVPTKPLTPAMRAQEHRVKRGRPVVGEGAEKVLVTLERSLLREADSYAKTHKINRSQLISESLRTLYRSRNSTERHLVTGG